MGRTPTRSKKRKFRGNLHCDAANNPRVDDGNSQSDYTFQSASARKIQSEGGDSSPTNAKNVSENVTGYRFTTICKLPFSASQKTCFKKLQLYSLSAETICFYSDTSRGRGQNY